MRIDCACPKSLQRHSAQIADLEPHLQTIPYNPGEWEKWVGAYDEFHALQTQLPGSVSRSDLTRLATEAMACRARLRKLFLAVMVFGYGNNGRKFRVRTMLETFDQQPCLLDGTLDLLLSGRVAEAHSGFRVAQCGPPFFTKFFYAVGLGAQLSPMPLILDSRVYQALNVLHDRGEIDQWQYYTRSAWTGEGYARYVEDMGGWASQLGCRADALEMYLFHHAGSLP